MSINLFETPENTDENGILCFGGELSIENLTAAYSNGVFPWPISGLPLTWFCPPTRAVLFFDQMTIPKSLKKIYSKNHFHFSINKRFSSVIQACADTKRPNQPGTWITEDIIKAFTHMHHLGYCHSIEVWNTKNLLVGGLYGVCFQGCFAAESMFYKEDNASKCAILYLVDYLKNKGCSWIDIQVMTPHMVKFGAQEIDRSDFLSLLKKTQKLELKPF